MSDQLPRAGETWKYAWLFAEIIKAGPKRVTWRSKGRIGWETHSTPTDDFLKRFSRTNLGPTR